MLKISKNLEKSENSMFPKNNADQYCLQKFLINWSKDLKISKNVEMSKNVEEKYL